MISAKIFVYARQNALLLAILAAVAVVGSTGMSRQLRVERRLAEVLGEMHARVQAIQVEQGQARARDQGTSGRVANAQVGIEQLTATGRGLDARINLAQIGIQQLFAAGAGIDARINKAQIGIEQMQALSGISGLPAAALLPALRTIFAETGATFTANDAFAGHGHSDVRRFVIDSQMAQATEPKIVIAGDSIVEASTIGVDGRFLNAGVAAARSADIVRMVAGFKQAGWPGLSCLVVQIGVNDANLAPAGHDEAYAATYAESLRKIADAVAGERPLVFLTPLTPDGGAEGMKVNLTLIASMQAEVKAKTGPLVYSVDIATPFRAAFANYADAFADGIHLSPVGYRVWKRLVSQAATAC